MDSFEEAKQNPDTQDMSNILDQSKPRSRVYEIKVTPSAQDENEEFLQKTDEDGTDYNQFRSIKGSIEHIENQDMGLFKRESN